MDFAEFIGANRHTIAIAQSNFGGVSVDIRFRLRLTGLPSTVAIGGFASAKQCHLKIIVVNITDNILFICLARKGIFLRYFTLELDDYLSAIAIRETKLWIGFYSGIIKVYKYTE